MSWVALWATGALWTAACVGVLVGMSLAQRFTRRWELLVTPFVVAVAAAVWPLTIIVMVFASVAELRGRSEP